MLRCQIRCNDVFGPRSAAKSLIQPDIKTKKGIQLSTAIHPENDKPIGYISNKASTLPSATMKIVFYEERNFKGRSYECSSDCTDMSSYLNRCYSCRVESGCWMVYDQSNFMGNQYFLRRGDYPDYMNMWGWGMNNWIRSCRMIPMFRGSYRMRMYERENFMGQMMDVTDDCDSIMDRYQWSSGCMSCHVMDGHWLMYEYPHYKGRMWYFRPGEYRSFREMMGSSSMRFMSMRRILDSWY
ncbi:gamma-crystallin M2 [Tachysurus ichikawai]